MRIVIGLILVMYSGSAASMNDPLCKSVGENWEWFGDHLAGSIDYYVSGPTGRMYEVGTGISFNGTPWGTKSTHEGAYRVTAYGIGAIHIRLKEGGSPIKVCVSGNIVSLVPLCGQFALDCSF